MFPNNQVFEQQKKSLSIWGIISTITAVVLGILMLLLFAGAAYFEMNKGNDVAANEAIYAFIGIGTIGVMIGHIFGLGIGIVGFFRKNQHKLFAYIGAGLNLMMLFILAGIILVGILTS